MCVIVHHPSGANLPSELTIEDCWLSNPDGAGVMFRRGQEVQIIKGLMTWDDFINTYHNCGFTKDTEFALHFRIATSGGICAENCHPFPVSPLVKELRMLRGTFSKALMHNGVFGKGDEKRKLSDTMLFVINTLSQSFVQENIENEIIQEYLSLKSEGSRLLLFSPKVTLRTGMWYEYKGCRYSNRSYEHWDYSWSKIGKAKSGIEDEHFAFKYICPECGSTELDDWADMTSDEELFQCLTCYTLIDEYGFHYTPEISDKKTKPAKKKPLPATKTRKKKEV